MRPAAYPKTERGKPCMGCRRMAIPSLPRSFGTWAMRTNSCVRSPARRACPSCACLPAARDRSATSRPASMRINPPFRSSSRDFAPMASSRDGVRGRRCDTRSSANGRGISLNCSIASTVSERRLPGGLPRRPGRAGEAGPNLRPGRRAERRTRGPGRPCAPWYCPGRTTRAPGTSRSRARHRVPGCRYGSAPGSASSRG